MDLNAPKGTFDVLPYGTDETWRLSSLWQYVEAVARQTATDYGYGEMRTPIYEREELFKRGVGDSSDIVTKEMFTFTDKGDRPMCLRPEGTSSVMRSFLEHKLGAVRGTHKFFYIGPMFRYERPQSGRYRQHHQFGIEAIGVAGPEQDAEVIDLLYTFYQRLGIRDLSVHLNTVGDPASRSAFRTALMDFLRPQFAELSADSQVRFEKNPLRILDSKDPKDKLLLKGSPSILDYLTPEATEHFAQVRALLEKIGIPYVVDDRLVRGLDYYNKTVFEVVAGQLGAQNTIGGGGRFDGLISTFGGPDLPAAGWATGLERVIHVLLAQGLPWTPAVTPFVYFVPLGDEAREQCFLLATACRHAKIPCDVELQAKKMQTALQNATKIGATYCVILGTEELSQQKGQLKNLQTREQKEVPFDQLVFTLKDLYV